MPNSPSPNFSLGDSSMPDNNRASSSVITSDSEHQHDTEKAIRPPTLDESPPDDQSPVVAPDAAPRGNPSVLARAASHASSTPAPPLTIVPRASRRGLCGRFTIVPEVERPYDYKPSTKWGITATIALAAMAAPMGSSIFYPALNILSKDLDTTETITNLSVAMYMLAMSIFPLWWSSFSEQFGRRTIYLVSFALFTIFSILCAVSTSISMLVVFRILTGGAAASVQAVGAGTIADIWQPRQRGRAMSTFYLGPLLGPMIAPILGGVLAQELGWRSTMYFLAIYGALVLLLLFFLLPETLPRSLPLPSPQVQQTLSRTTTRSAAESAKERSVKVARFLGRAFIDPLRVLLFLRFPPVLITVLVAAVTFGALFVVNISIQNRFSQPPYGFSQLIVGLLYIPSGLGYLIAALFGGRWLDNIMAREARRANRHDEKGRLIYLPEDRMRENMWLANSLYPMGMLLFGWTLQYGVIWIVPSIGTFAFGFASMLVFSASTTMLTEFVHSRSSAGVAVNNFVRNILSCVGIIVAAPWINAIGTGWVFTILAIFCLAFGFAGIWVLRRNASRWRQHMDSALNKM
ncbi:hypothetical protein CDD82_4850 [Ophiocordyceps australis]|uniref:Major facilitator superfamily (MFS) profile domain-containing protein n=1 Tax=Ophiocordyceps australis TaxID=1399860 RepID=A0A2C5ZS12_9HYPO|nr:hypothetical protein CDD82_4850 [Ophiocordyceps australis]